MAARAIWQATLKIGKQSLPVKLYSAVEDRQIHFHMLHKRDRTRVHQQMVDGQTGRPVSSDEIIKAFQVEPGRYVKVTDEEIERTEPTPGRDVNVSRFVPSSAINPFLFDRPYYLGPDSDAIPDYLALGAALEKKKKAGLAHWVMRKHSYRAALIPNQGYLMLITLRSASEVIPLEQLDPPGGPALSTREKDLAARLLDELSGTFRPDDYHDEYQKRVLELIAAKRSGKRLKRKRLPRAKPRRPWQIHSRKACAQCARREGADRARELPMPAAVKRRRSKSRQPKRAAASFHAFWSGSLSFGLVNVRVLVFPASRHTAIRLRLLSPAGSLLKRRFYCPREEKPLRDDEIIRGYELDDGSYITLEDKELEALEPEKTREIALQEFVPVSELPAYLFERGYYLTPQEDAKKAYRLLAEVLERKQRAGIATFVMHDREYVVAIFGRSGVLCAQTLRFHDELREPGAIGLPDPSSPPKARVTAFERIIDARSVRAVPHAELDEHDDQKLRAIIQKKLKSGKDLIQISSERSQPDHEDDDDQDLVELIRKSLR